ncbi:MAG TPA: lytic transglycosylase, partial [Polaromonas sp.]|nr:lytic transglycosylase [Polaromonas sp.]
MLYKFLFSAALPAVLSVALSATLAAPAAAQTTSSGSGGAGDALILEMNKAFKRGDKAKLAQLLPQARGHVLEPWTAYWELKARLDEASPQEVQDFFNRYAGTYQEDRLRNDWLLLLGQRRDWAAFEAEYPKYRMNDDREVRCYALLVEHLKNPALDARLADEVRKNWQSQRDADDGCTAAAERLVGTKNLTQKDVWQKARLATEASRPRAARDAVQIIAPEALGLMTELSSSPTKFLSEKYLALRKVRKEIITLALIKLATSDVEGAARQMDRKWAVQLTAEERNWVWGVIGKQAATRMGTLPASDALQYFAKVSKDSDLNDDMLAWKARAALRAGTQPNWPQVAMAINAMSGEARQDPTWTYWKARALLATAPPDAAPKAAASGVTQTMSIAPQRAEA